MIDQPIEGRSMAFTKEGSKNPSQVVISNERKIGEGNFGDVYEADVAIGKHIRKFVIKKFKDTTVYGQNISAEEGANQAIRNYNEAKRAGLKIFTTYRLGENGTSVLMTNASSESTICLTTNDSANLPAMGEPKIEEIEGVQFETLTNEVFQQAEIAANHGILIYRDAFFFLFNRDTKNVDFVLGDLDIVNRRPNAYSNQRLLNNLMGARMSLEHFVSRNVAGQYRYNAEIKRIWDELKYKHGYV